MIVKQDLYESGSEKSGSSSTSSSTAAATRGTRYASLSGSEYDELFG